MSNAPKLKCIVKGCPNKKSEGVFVGAVCGPCYTLLTTGELNYGEDFISKALRKLLLIRELIGDTE